MSCTETEEKGATENCQYVKDFVDKKVLQELLDMGFSLLRAEKALLFTNNIGLDAAIGWLDDNQDDPLVDDPVTEVSTGETEKKKLTKEEAEARGMELQKKLSQRRKELDKKEAQEKERERIKSTKAMLETNRILEESARKKAIAEAKREREIDLAEKKRLEELMKRDWEERFGRPYDSEVAKPKERKIAKSVKDQIILHLNTMKKEYETNNRVGLKKCLSTLRIYATNAKDNPTEKKYHRIRKTNQTFSNDVLPFNGASDLLEACGFTDTGEFFEIVGLVSDGFTLSLFLKYVNLILNSL